MPIGMLMRKIQCHDHCSVTKPPSSGPTIALMPNTAPNSPWYLPRSAGVNRSPMTARLIGNRAPAPRPWMPRKRISWVMSWLRADSAEPIRNTVMPNIRIGLRPYRSDSLP